MQQLRDDAADLEAAVIHEQFFKNHFFRFQFAQSHFKHFSFFLFGTQ